MFEKWDQAQYRAATEDALEQRRGAIRDELVSAESEVATADLKSEMDMLADERQRRSMAESIAAAQERSSKAKAVAAGAGTVINGMQAVGAQKRGTFEVVREEDPFDTEEYNRAFAEYATRGREYPAGLVQPGQRPEYVRADAFTQTTDVQHFIPTTLASQIITKMDSYGDLWPLLTKMSVQGGLDINYWDYKPTASWVTESKPADFQKADDASTISFKYYMAECRVAQSQLANLTTLEQFRSKFPELCAEAIVRLLEQGYLNGTGTGQMLGILKDTRIPAANKVVLSEADAKTWAGWSSNVKARMKKSYRDGLFIMAQGTWDTYIDGMVDTTGQPIARVNYGLAGATDEQYRFMGKRVIIVEDDLLPAFDDAKDGSADVPCIVFTRPSDYIVNMQQGIRMAHWVDEDSNLVKDKVQVVCDGKVGDPNGTLVISAPKKA